MNKIILSIIFLTIFNLKIKSDILQNIDQISSTVGLFTMLNSVQQHEIQHRVECPDKKPGCEVIHYNCETKTGLNYKKFALGSLLLISGLKNLDLRKLILSCPAMYLLTKANYKFQWLKNEDFSFEQLLKTVPKIIDNVAQATLISLALYVK